MRRGPESFLNWKVITPVVALALAGAVTRPWEQMYANNSTPANFSLIDSPATGETGEEEITPEEKYIFDILDNNPHLQRWRDSLGMGVVTVDVYNSYQQGYVSSTDGVNIRSAPDATAPRVSSLTYGEIFDTRLVVWVQTEEAEEIWAVTREVSVINLESGRQHLIPLFSILRKYTPIGYRSMDLILNGRSTDFERFVWSRIALQKEGKHSRLP